jgi:membrane protease YdiL (CAAX protease family)
MKRFFRFLTAVLPFFAAEAIQIVVINMLTFIYSFYIGFKLGFENNAGGISDNTDFVKEIEAAVSQEMMYLFSVIAVLACGFVFIFWYRLEIRGEVRGSLKHVFALKNIGLLVVLGIGCQFFFTGVMSLIQPLLAEIFENYARVLEGLTSGNDLVVILLMVLIAPIAEELVFRGVILHRANKHVSFLGANILQGLLFGVYHWNLVQGIYAAILGFLFGLVYRKFKSIAAPIVLHVFVNSSSFLMLLLPDNTISIIASTVLGTAFVLSSLYLLKLSESVPLKTVPDSVYEIYEDTGE